MIRTGSGHVHLAGICGVGMAGLAVLLKSRGLKVSGCDLAVSSVAEWLKGRGIAVAAGHDPAHLAGGVRWIIRSSAVPRESAEIKAAARLGVPVLMRGETLAALLDGFESVAVAGTHGKTTTTGLITQILRACGRDPSFCIGGEIPSLGGVAGIGSGKALVVEADESDGTLSRYTPDYAVITNIEQDHVEHFGSMDALRRCFGKFVQSTRKAVIYCADDPGATALCEGWIKAISYGFADNAAIRGTRIIPGAESSRFTVSSKGRRLGSVRLPLPGRHNVANALAAIAVALEMGLKFGPVQKALAKVGLPKRRFEKAVCTRDQLVISDYGHHPSEIRALLAAVKPLDRSRRHGRGRIRAVFQPHRYSRTLALGSQFPGAFSGADEVVLVPVYAASEHVISGGTISDLYTQWRAQQTGGGAHGTIPPALLAGSLEQAWQYLGATQRNGDTLLVVGAGDVEKIAGWAKAACAGKRNTLSLPRRAAGGRRLVGLRVEASSIRCDEAMAPKTTFKVGGCSDVWIEIGSVGDLQRVIRYSRGRNMQFRIIGAGSNILACDTGVRGISARLTGEEFKRIERDGLVVTAGACVPIVRLLGWLERNGLAGLEFLEGVPGTVGGAIRMNAGAWGHDVGEYVSWVRQVDADGEVRLLRHPEFAYRRGMVSGAVVEAAFKLRPGTRAGIAGNRMRIARKRAWMKGLRCAGSVFRNPPGDHAGRLIEKAGLKGKVVGGASISRRHANVIVTQKGACASDVLALIGLARTAVKLKFGVDLETELEIL